MQAFNDSPRLWPGLACTTILALSLGMASTSVEAQLSEADRQAMIDLYESTNGDEWLFNDNWLGEPGTECDWFGISCSDGSDSYALALSSNNLSGEIPDSLANAEGLRFLLMSNNDLTGTWQLGESDLPRVIVIELDNNRLEGFDLAPDSAPQLTFLDLSNNQLSTFPEGLDGLELLHGLRLSHNQLSGELPGWFSDLSLEELYLADNQLSGSILPALAAMEENLEPGNPDSLSKGVLLDLRGNRFSGTIEPEAAGYNQGIQGWLDLCWNDLSATDQAVRTWLQLEHFGNDFDQCLDQSLQSPELTSSGSWYDPDHSGQGMSIMHLEDGQTVVHWFTYAPLEDGSQRQSWLVSSRNIEHHGFEMLLAQGPVGGDFGQGLPNTNEYPIDIYGELNLYWTESGLTVDQRAQTEPMSEAAQGRAELSQLTRLAGTTCSNQQPQQWISGAWYNPAASGEGLAIEVAEDGQGHVYWFTYEGGESGAQAWMLGTGEFEGNTLYVDEVDKTSGGYFGADLDPDAIEVTDWGSLTIEFSEEGPSELNWDSNLSAYGSGTQQIEQLAAAKLADCD